MAGKGFKAGDIVKVICSGTDCGEATVKNVDEKSIWVEYPNGARIKFTGRDTNIMLIKKVNDSGD